jgi:ribosome-binding protein aMBF1 (putative translation factor)
VPNYTNKELLVKFGEMIKTARLEAGLRQTELAQALDIQQGTISAQSYGRSGGCRSFKYP